MSSKVKLIQGLCIAVVTLLMAGNAVGAAAQDPRALQRNAMGALQLVSGEIDSALVEHPGDQQLLLVKRALHEVSANNGQPLSAARASQNLEIALLTAGIYNMCMAIHRRVGDLSNKMTDEEKALRDLLDHRVP